MTERTTLARPYAEAVFRLASEHKALKPWSEMLQLAVAVMQDPQVAALVENPRVPRARFVEFFLDVWRGSPPKFSTGKHDISVVIYITIGQRKISRPYVAEILYDGENRISIVDIVQLKDIDQGINRFSLVEI